MTSERKTMPGKAGRDWIVVANAARARIFERDGEDQALREIADCVHTPSRQKASEIDDDRPGQARKSQASTAFTPHTETRNREHQHFAHEVAQLLENAALSHDMPGLVLLASNPFLGELKAELGTASQRLLKFSVPVDLTIYQHADLEQRVTRALDGRAV